MRNKRFMFIALLILAVGFASVSTVLYITGNLAVATNQDDFDVYFSKAIVDGEDKSSEVIIEDGKKIKYSTKELKSLNDESILEYEVTNASHNYNADVSVVCTPTSTSYVSLVQTPASQIINARETENGSVTVTLNKVSTENITQDFECVLSVSALERTVYSNDDLTGDDYIFNGKLKNNGVDVTSGSVVIYSETPHYAEVNADGSIIVPFLERGSHEIYYLNNKININEYTKEQVINASVAKGAFTTSDKIVELDNDYSFEGEVVKSYNYCKTIEGQTIDYAYTGGEQTFKPLCSGTYKLETWGAQGGSYNSTYKGGYGAYSVGEYYINETKSLNIVVGGAGAKVTGGYNGGGLGNNYNVTYSGGGGGATHIATSSGKLYELSSNRDSVIIVSGGGAGSYGYSSNWWNGNSGGGYIGGYSSDITKAGAQESGYAFGSSNTSKVHTNSTNYSGGGSGWYGGYSYWGEVGAGGGSSYIGNLSNASMYCYDCQENDGVINPTYKTIKTNGSDSTLDKTNCPNGYSSNALAKCAKAGNGYARITYLGYE